MVERKFIFLILLKHLQKAEARDRKTFVILYFDQITTKKNCPEIRAIREHIVDDLKNSPIVVYDYYNPGKEKPLKINYLKIFDCF